MALKEPNAIVAQRIEVTENLIKLRIVPDGWELPSFIPGQFGVLGLPATAPRYPSCDPDDPPIASDKMILRAYSIASSSVLKEYLEFYIALIRSGSLTPRLLSLRPGDKVWLSPKLRGMFTLSEVPAEFNLILIATGTGIAPYISMIRTEVAQGIRRKFAVIHGARHSSDLGYHDELMTLSAANESFKYIPILSHAHEERIPWKGHKGFVQVLWTDGALDEAWGSHPTPQGAHVFLCGNPIMIREMEEILAKEQFKKHSKKEAGQVHIEQFFIE